MNAETVLLVCSEIIARFETLWKEKVPSTCESSLYKEACKTLEVLLKDFRIVWEGNNAEPENNTE
jgi:hypothetical protein